MKAEGGMKNEECRDAGEELFLCAEELRVLITRAEGLLQFVERGREMETSLRIVSGVEQIVSVVCKEFGVCRGAVFSRVRTERTARVRQCCMTLARRKLSATSTAIGEIFKRDHGCVLHAEESTRARCETDADFARAFSRCCFAINNISK